MTRASRGPQSPCSQDAAGWQAAFDPRPVDEIAAELAGAVLKDLSLRAGQQAILLVNGFGGTPALELYVIRWGM